MPSLNGDALKYRRSPAQQAECRTPQHHLVSSVCESCAAAGSLALTVPPRHMNRAVRTEDQDGAVYMTQRETAKPGATRRLSHGRVARGVTRGLALAALLLPAFSSADAQTGAPVAGGPSVAITDTPGGRAGAEKAAAANTDAASAGTAATDTATAEAPPAPAQAADAKPDGFTVGGFTFKPGGRVKL